MVEKIPGADGEGQVVALFASASAWPAKEDTRAFAPATATFASAAPSRPPATGSASGSLTGLGRAGATAKPEGLAQSRVQTIPYRASAEVKRNDLFAR